MSKISFQPIIKWTGSKRSQANEIIKYFPQNIETYYEPFLGGGSMLRTLIDSDINVKHYICSDKNNDLIMLWKSVKYSPEILKSTYRELWNNLNSDDNMIRRKEYYNRIRNEFNKNHNPYQFNFLLRESLNGMVRYNKKGDFNSPFHFTRKGIVPDSFDKIVDEWFEKLNSIDIKFINSDYKEITPKEDDFIYLDPPYANTKGLYYGLIAYDELWNYIKKIKCKYALSFDGKVGDDTMTYNVPIDLYSKHIYINSGKSSFRRLINTVKENKDENVFESLYLK